MGSGSKPESDTAHNTALEANPDQRENGKNFALTGIGGYIAPRHLKAIQDTRNQMIAAVDPNDSVGIIDRYFPNAYFFREFERFDRHIEKLRRHQQGRAVDFVSICSPNYLHDAHIRFALRVGADAICEKPLVLNPWNVEALAEIAAEHGRNIYTVLQLRLHPSLVDLRERIRQEAPGTRHRIDLTYVTSRGKWYLVSWKGNLEQSGGLATNIGIHFFDVLMWIFGPVSHSAVHLSTPTGVAGSLVLERADVRWFLSIDGDDLPDTCKAGGQTTFRSITIDGEEIEFSGGFTDLHTRVYEDILAGGGYGPEAVLPSIALAHDIRSAEPSGLDPDAHPYLQRR